MDENKELMPYTLKSLENDLLKISAPLHTGFKCLDDLASIPQNTITLVAARPSHGKTTFLLNVLVNMLKRNPEKSFLYFTLLESRKQIGLKVINILSGEVLNVSNNLGAIGKYIKEGSDGKPALESGKAEFNELTESGRLWIMDDCSSVENLAERIKRLKEKHDIGAVFIDYIQKIDVKDWSLSAEVALQRISHQLLNTAKELSVPLIVGAQLKWDERRILRLDNFYEVSAAVQDAALVLGLYNHAMESSQVMGERVDESSLALKITVLKNHDGKVNEMVSLRLDAPTMTLSETASRR